MLYRIRRVREKPHYVALNDVVFVRLFLLYETMNAFKRNNVFHLLG